MKKILVPIPVILVLALSLIGCSNSYQKGYNAGYQAAHQQTIVVTTLQPTVTTPSQTVTTPQQRDIVFNMNYAQQNERLASIERANVTNKSIVTILNVYVKATWYDNTGAIVASTDTTVAQSIKTGESASGLVFPPDSVSSNDVSDYHLYWTWGQ